MRRVLLAITAGALFVGLAGGPALACGGLIGRNGAVSLVRTTTLAAYAGGVEHYVTSFQFAGAGGEFGSIVPLPGVPTDVKRGGDWTLQRLVREVTPTAVARANSGVGGVANATSTAEVLLQTKVDALDLTVLKGGAVAIGEWAAGNGFLLPPDAPEVLEFYATRSPIFLAAKFDADAARQRGTVVGDGTPVHITIPTDNPWVPLRILALGLRPQERVAADVFLLTPARPTLVPGNPVGLGLSRSEVASASLLADLRSDKGMEWVPESMWLSFLRVDARPADLTYDLAVDATGAGLVARMGIRPTAVNTVVANTVVANTVVANTVVANTVVAGTVVADTSVPPRSAADLTRPAADPGAILPANSSGRGLDPAGFIGLSAAAALLVMGGALVATARARRP